MTRACRRHPPPRYAATSPITAAKTASPSAHLRIRAARSVPLLPLLVSRCRSTLCRLALSACSATASRLQQLRTLETTRPHDNTPTGRRSPGLFCSLRSAPSHALQGWQGWQGWTCCGMLDSMLQYNRPRRRDEVADFVAALRRRLYLFAAVRLALCSRLPISSRLPSAQTRATADAGAELTHAGAQAQRMQREHAGHEQGQRRRGEASPRADVRGGWGVLMI